MFIPPPQLIAVMLTTLERYILFSRNPSIDYLLTKSSPLATASNFLTDVFKTFDGWQAEGSEGKGNKPCSVLTLPQ